VITREYTTYICWSSLHKDYVEFELHWSASGRDFQNGVPRCPECGWHDDVENWSEREEAREQEEREAEENKER